MGRIGCVGIVKNEEAHIAEWLAWQFLIGFDTVFLLDNGSTDATAAIARALAPRLDVRVFDYPYSGPDWQLRGYEQTIRVVAGEFEWLAFFGTDEFLVLDKGEELKSMLAARPEAAVAVSWAIFGSSGHEEMPGDLVIETFSRRSQASFPLNRHVKSIIRPQRMRAVLNSHVFGMDGDYVDLRGRPVRWQHTAGYAEAEPDYAGGKLHHYFTRSASQWRAKPARDYAGGGGRQAEEFMTYDRNEVFDDSAARHGAEISAMLTPLPAAETALQPAGRGLHGSTQGWRLGIAITTFNRRDLILATIENIRALTQTPYELVICDDGSSDGTAEALRAQGLTVIGGTNRGIAWNKNRGIYYLLQIARCDVVLLLDDDIVPVEPGWERGWVEAAWRYGHVNQAHPDSKAALVAGDCTVQLPGLTTRIPGWIFACTRFVLAQIGYLDVRFGRYGHEHSEFSHRAVRAGFGGIATNEEGRSRTYYYVIEGGVQGVPSPSTGSQADIDANTLVLAALQDEPVYRHAWRDDLQMAAFLAEIAAAAPAGVRPYIARTNQSGAVAPPAMSRARPDNISCGKRATQSSHCNWSFGSTLEADAAGGVNGVLDGARHFHTDIEDNPWWQVDLGGIATITGIHVHNTSEGTHDRFRDFTIGVSIDGLSWVDVLEKRDGAAVTEPVMWAGPGTAWARFVRVTLLGRNYLHLCQVEVFGTLP